ncbi:MAG: NAD(P)/FAD-dependent oxidoreductase [Actinomycetota bacterium]
MRAEAVICGAGIAGVATAYQLVVEHGLTSVVMVDPRPPLTLTSDKSTECYRNWWPGKPMVDLMNRSIDLLEEMAGASGDAFHLTPRGYLYVTADSDRLNALATAGANIGRLGAGALRTQPGADYRVNGRSSPGDGADLFLNGEELRHHFPFLSSLIVGGLHVRRAGWFSAQQLGAWMIDQATARGMRIEKTGVTAVELAGGKVSGVKLASGTTISTGCFVNAAGPMVAEVARLVGVDLPVYSEVHMKVAFRDHLGVLPRDAPMIIWADPQELDWTDEERSLLAEELRHDLLGKMPPSCHARPEGGSDSPWLLGLWEYHRVIQQPSWPLPFDPLYPEVVMKGLTRMVPRLASYQHALPQHVVDGGYYTKTKENRPLIGPLPVEGSYVVGAFSGFGVMVAAAAGDLAALHITGGRLPDYAPAFSLDRYQDPHYLDALGREGEDGQI